MADDKIPELTQQQRDLMALGLCPFCEKPIRGWRAPSPGPFAPEMWASLKDMGIDGRTGHAETCKHKKVRL